jgi:serine/threonine protein kinase
LLEKPAQEAGMPFTREEKRMIRAFGGRFPCFVQQICYAFFDAHLKGITNYEEIMKSCLIDVQEKWMRFWEKLSLQHQRALFSIACGRQQNPLHLLADLETAALIYKENEYYFPFSDAFGKFILARDHALEGFPVKENDVLWGLYTVEEVHNTGNSQVVKALHRDRSERYWAIKLLFLEQKEYSDQDIAAKRDSLLREVKIIDSLKHPNIGEIHDVQRNPLGIIMSWIEGRSLERILEEHEKLELAHILNIGAKLADALHHVHEKGIVHRDIKPLNIILTRNNNPILIDFDIAHSKNHHTVAVNSDGVRSFVGTADYSPPEQFDVSQPVGPEADIFALGVVLYQLLTFELPYQVGNSPRFSTYVQQLPLRARQEIPDPVYRLFCKMLSPNQNDRPEARDVCESLLRIQDL